MEQQGTIPPPPPPSYGSPPPPGMQYGTPPYPGMMPEISPKLKIVFYIISFVIWIGGIVLYLVYRNKPHPEDQKVAKNCLKLAIISLALIIAYNVIIAFLTFMAMRASYYVP